MKDLSIIIPALNERESINELYSKIMEMLRSTFWNYEIIFVDDGSTDGTSDVVKQIKHADPNVFCLRFRKNQGKAAALAAGFSRATGKYVITMDADLQDDPAEIPKMVSLLDDGYDLVSGWKKVRHDPIGKTIPSKFFNLMLSFISGVRLHDFNCGLKAYKNEVVKSFKLYGELHRYLPALANWSGYLVTEVDVKHHSRKFGTSKYGVGRILHGFFDLVTIAFLNRYTKRPLHFFGTFGSILVGLGLLVLSYFGVMWVFTGEMHLRPLVLLAVASIILGIQFISIGLLGEMITFTGHSKDIATDIQEI